MYTILFDVEAINFLNSLPNNIKKRIFSKIMNTKENPFHFFERLTGRSDFKLRVGDYRVVADILQNEKVIQVTFIGHRKNVYNNLLL